MKSLQLHRVYNEIYDCLLSKDFLKTHHIKEDFIKSHLQSSSFIDFLEEMLETNNYSCKAVFMLCKNILMDLWEKKIPQDPLQYIYQFTLSLSFPNSVELDLKNFLNNGCFLYLKVLRVISQHQKLYDDSMQSKYPLDLLPIGETNNLMNVSEYKSFVGAFYDDYIYEMMKLNHEVTGHNTLDHICGVHHLAVFIAEQLLSKNIPLDLGRVSGGAAGHDIGKFGCRSSESKRVAYLHYYYTDQWFKKHNIPNIGHVALNHSVWDLELENLSIESLILIYSDFRVKNISVDNNRPSMKMIGLEDAFDIILGKLDNVDKNKENRYRRVYMKLKDFEDFLLSIDIIIDPHILVQENVEIRKTYYALMEGKGITEHLKYIAIHHNINLMYKFRDETSLNEIIEIARAEQDPKVLREYLDLFEEYSTYLTQKQKIIAIKFLYEKIIHPEEDIRRQCASTIGSLIATFDENYRKEIPEGLKLEKPKITSYQLLHQYMKSYIYPDHKIIPLHRRWIRYSLATFIDALFIKCKAQQEDIYKEIILKYYKEEGLEEDIYIALIQSLKYIPLNNASAFFKYAVHYVISFLKHKDDDIRISALDTLGYLAQNISKECETHELILNQLTEVKLSSIPAENFLYLKIAETLCVEDTIIDNLKSFYNQDVNKISSMFLNNLKTEINWVTKKFHIKLLLEHALKNTVINKLYIAMHFSNLLKVSAVENVRSEAGESLVEVFPHLPMEQRNDLAIELLRTLEIEGAQFTKYIPNYLGQIIIYLKPLELDEIIEDLIEKIKHANTHINSLLLKTIGVFISNYPKYKEIFKEEDVHYNRRLTKMLGILLNGLVHHNPQIKQVSFSVIGKEVFGLSLLTLEEKYYIFQLVGKKVLTLLTDSEESELLFLTNSAGLNHIYRFISSYKFAFNDICVKTPEKVAFFPGSFDPFTLGHKEIAKAIRDLGFEVYLAVDEFSWSKRTQPNLQRKNIINMSIADEMDIYLYPEDFPVNLANPENLNDLKNNFCHSKVYIVVGTDVILNASAYKRELSQSTITDFPHIIFERRSDDCDGEKAYDMEKILITFKQPVIKLNLPPQYEDISSTQIRNYIDENRDISKLIDPLSQKYIYTNNLYRREPQYKSLVQTISIDIDVRNSFNYEIINTIASIFHPKDYHKTFKNIEAISQKKNATLILIRDAKEHCRILAYSIFHWLPSDLIYQEFQDSHLSQCVRENYTGRIILLDGIFVREDIPSDNIRQIILTETLAYCVKNDYGYGIFTNKIDDRTSRELYKILKLHGFQELSHSPSHPPVLAVNMTNPCSLNLDIQTFIKEPFRSNENVKTIISATRKRLQEALTKLYPGHLVLCFDRDIVEETLVKKICRENEVPPLPVYPKKLGSSMCVPFGNILNRAIVPNTVTKTLHTEKMFNPNMKHFIIGAFPYYLSLEKQIRIIHAFNKPVILIDDLLNKGYRIKALDPILKKENIHVKKIVVGMLSGQGKELMEIQNREVDSAYFIPKLRHWFNEGLLYPFIGGDTLWRGIYPQKNLLPSINLILPYTSPSFIKGVSNESLYNLSLVCIQNALEILKVLEMTYQKTNERKLTLSLLGEVFLYPRCPDQGKNSFYDFNVNPSTHLNRDLELLKRLEYNFIKSS
ncbi:cytidyltransferase [Natronincola ferrireducens]|uniref:nicotinate-nucleotide adenylyltransferase n=1 Tax=Natronincola ferrireducens TaxID=393762 RepID=A0A1G9EM27_9FIRM|nr:cytidyltransferase [Natronincola ferrireducens]SDK77164.1 Nicotinic acid mononucleotide adenylyltransferase [Natronincola ferrireducens]